MGKKLYFSKMPKRILSAATTAANRVRARLWRLAQKAEGPEFNLKMKLTMRVRFNILILCLII